MIKSVFLPFGGDAEGDITFESPEKMADLHSSADTHDGVEMVGHGHGDKRRPATLLFQATDCFHHEPPAPSIIKMACSSVLMAKGDEDGVAVAGPRRASMGERFSYAVVHPDEGGLLGGAVEAGNYSGTG
jgi:hypothetical protein